MTISHDDQPPEVASTAFLERIRVLTEALETARPALFNLIVDCDALWGSVVDRPSREAKQALHMIDKALQG